MDENNYVLISLKEGCNAHGCWVGYCNYCNYCCWYYSLMDQLCQIKDYCDSTTNHYLYGDNLFEDWVLTELSGCCFGIVIGNCTKVHYYVDGFDCRKCFVCKCFDYCLYYIKDQQGRVNVVSCCFALMVM